MKKVALILTGIIFLVLGTQGAKAQTPIGFGEISITNASTTVPVQLVSTNLLVKSVTIIGKKAAQTDNAAVVYLGLNSTNDTQALEVPVGSSSPLVITAAEPGKVFDLSQWYMDVGTAGDGVYIYYQ